jgi:hypothetical protein
MGIKHVEAFSNSLLVVQQVVTVFQCFDGSFISEQGEKSSWYLEVGKGGECSWPPDLDPPAHDLKIHNAMVGLLDL